MGFLAIYTLPETPFWQQRNDSNGGKCDFGELFRMTVFSTKETEQMSNKLGVEHQPENVYSFCWNLSIQKGLLHEFSSSCIQRYSYG